MLPDASALVAQRPKGPTHRPLQTPLQNVRRRSYFLSSLDASMACPGLFLPAGLRSCGRLPAGESGHGVGEGKSGRSCGSPRGDLVVRSALGTVQQDRAGHFAAGDLVDVTEEHVAVVGAVLAPASGVVLAWRHAPDGSTSGWLVAAVIRSRQYVADGPAGGGSGLWTLNRLMGPSGGAGDLGNQAVVVINALGGVRGFNGERCPALTMPTWMHCALAEAADRPGPAGNRVV
jgi:hypothetical protein